MAILDNPGPEVLKYGTRERLEEKLGWLRQFRERLKDWSEMEQTIDVVLNFVRTQGLYRGAAKDLRKQLRKLPVGASAAQLRDDLTKFVAGQARRLKPGERIPGTSEVIESAFGKFKTVERDQAKGGFTGLLLALAACVAERTQEVVHETLQKTRTRDVIAWIKTKLGDTVGSKRRIAYQAARASLRDANKSKSETKPEGTSVAIRRLIFNTPGSGGWPWRDQLTAAEQVCLGAAVARSTNGDEVCVVEMMKNEWL